MPEHKNPENPENPENTEKAENTELTDREATGIFFTMLSDEGQKLVPVNYRHIRTRAAAHEDPTRMVESKFHRSQGYSCWTYHKPISKCCGGDEPT